MSDRDAAQARWLASVGRLSPAALRHNMELYAATPADARPQDFAAFLLERGALTPEQAAEARLSAVRLQPGAFGRFVVERELSRGGMGILYLGRDPSSAAQVAIKTALGGEEDLREALRFQREAAALASLEHPNLVRFWEAGEAGGRPYFVMDLVDGEPLQERARKVARDGVEVLCRWACEVFAEVADALVAVHAAGLVHRDLKPANILIERRTERPVLVDFGLAGQITGSAEEVEARLTHTGEALGTPAYMAPEQLDGAGQPIGPHTDVWGLGATLVAALTDAPPYGELNPVNVYKRLLSEDPPSPRDRIPDLPAGLDALCLACLQRDPARRPTMTELRDQLRGEDLLAPPPLPSRSRLGIALLALAALGLLVAVAATPKLVLSPTGGEPQLRWASPPPERVAADAVELELALEEADVVSLLVLSAASDAYKARREVTREAQALSLTIPLSPGLNEVWVRLQRRGAPVSTELKASITSVREPLRPILSIPEEGLTVFEASLVFDLDPGPDATSLSWDLTRRQGEARVVSRGAGRRVEVPLLDGEQALELVVRDELGREASFERLVRKAPTLDLSAAVAAGASPSEALQAALRGREEALRVRLAPGRYTEEFQIPALPLLELCGPDQGCATFVLSKMASLFLDGGRVVLTDLDFEGALPPDGPLERVVPGTMTVTPASIHQRGGELLIRRCRFGGEAPNFITLVGGFTSLDGRDRCDERWLWVEGTELRGAWADAMYLAGEAEAVVQSCRFLGERRGGGCAVTKAMRFEARGCEFRDGGSFSVNAREAAEVGLFDCELETVRSEAEGAVRMEGCAFSALDPEAFAAHPKLGKIGAQLTLDGSRLLMARGCVFDGPGLPAIELRSRQPARFTGCLFRGRTLSWHASLPEGRRALLNPKEAEAESAEARDLELRWRGSPTPSLDEPPPIALRPWAGPFAEVSPEVAPPPQKD